ncbi:MAG: hypothetical protein ACOC23_00735 [Thermodesulfobacteriota bacterium]
MQIHQLNLSFSPEEDRIIFKFNTVQKEEFRFWITRRFLKILVPVLRKLLKAEYVRREPNKAHIADALMEFEQDRVISKSNFQKAYAVDIQDFPLGKDAILFTQIRLKKGPRGDILCLLPKQGRGIELGADHRFLHALCRLLKDVVRKADWNLGEEIWGEVHPNNDHPKGGMLH